jgi:indoleamine 2,3-dioxygenase
MSGVPAMQVHSPDVVPTLAAFDVSAERGFLPATDPLEGLERPGWAPVMQLAQELPKLLAARHVRASIDRLPEDLPDSLEDWSVAECRCAARVLSFLSHAYVWEDPHRPARRLPARLAVPWCRIMQRLGRPPVLSYASYCLDNWRRLDPTKPIELGNLALLNNFLGGLDEEWFVLVHVDIEAKAGQALAGVNEALAGAVAHDPDRVVRGLEHLVGAEERMVTTLLRMPERCDPYIYYNRVRPFIHGWKDNLALPDGLVYEGVAEFGERPQQFRGETGAQSSIIPSLDAALGVTHAEGPLTHYLDEMREYMPPAHRAYLAALEALWDGQGRALLYGYCLDHRQREPRLWAAFRDSIQQLARFRETHYEYADRYIHRQHQRSLSNPTAVGTGGTPFMTYLKEYLEETTRILHA